MPKSGTNWSTQQLVEFLDAVTSATGMASALELAVERAADAFDAEVAATVHGRALGASVGFARDEVPEERIVAAAWGEAELELEGLGSCAVAIVPIGDGSDGRLIVARVGTEPFPKHDVQLLRGMGRVLDLTLNMLRGLEDERALRVQSQHESHERQLAERKYRGLVEQLPAIVYTADPGEFGRFRYVSPRIEEIMGFTAEEWLADPGLWVSRIHPDDRADAVAVENEKAAQQDPSPADYRMIAKDGRILDIHDEGVLEHDVDGAPYWHGVLYDVTETKRMEEETQRLKDEFLGLVSHELRTPLTSIVGYANVLSDDEGAVTARGRRAVKVIERNSARLLKLVDELLLAQQLESGSFEINLGPVRLSEIAAECVERALPAAAEKDVELVVVADPLPSTSGDPDRLTQAIDNLLSNALKFTPAGGRVLLRVNRVDGRIRIEVADTGVGIPASDHDRLFERFYRTSDARDAATPGAGIGLSIVQAIVEGHGGTVSVNSEVGGGTAFLVDLPFEPWSESADRSRRDPALHARLVAPLAESLSDE